MKKGDYALQAGSKPFELGVLFVRLFRSLDAIVGGDEAVASAWLANPQPRPRRNARRENPLRARPHECHRLPGRTQGYHLSFDRMRGASGASSRPSTSSQP